MSLITTKQVGCMINVSGKVELHYLWFYCQSKSLNGSLSLLVASLSVASSSLSPTLQLFKSFDVYLVIFRTIYCYRDATLFEGVNGHVLLGRDFLPGLPDPLREENSSFTCCDSAPHIIFQVLLYMTVCHCASLKSLLNTTFTGCTILVVPAGTKIGSVLHLSRKYMYFFSVFESIEPRIRKLEGNIWVHLLEQLLSLSLKPEILHFKPMPSSLQLRQRCSSSSGTGTFVYQSHTSIPSNSS